MTAAGRPGADQGSPRTVLSRAFAILDTFAEGQPEQTHGSITRATGMSPATVHRQLAELVEWGAVERTRRGHYRIGLHLWRLGSLAPQGRELRDVALPYLQDLLEVTHEVVHLVVLDENMALYIEKLESRPDVAVVSRVGGRLPLHATGPGKVLLAYAPPAVLNEVLAGGLTRQASGTITDARELQRALAEIRRTGHCISRQEMTDGAASVAAPVTDAHRRVIAAISVVVPSSTPDLSPLVPPVRLAALGISRELRSRRHVAGEHLDD
jgi:DNA-binding IclR family transcriptional regulator